MSLCTDYLLARGITEDTANINGLELDHNIIPKKIRERLGLGFQRGYSEVLWFPVRDATGDLIAWIARPLPTMVGHPNFTVPSGRVVFRSFR
jgi:hypothetical protein